MKRIAPSLLLFAFCLSAQMAKAVNSYSGQLATGYYKFNRPATTTTLSGQQVYYHAVFFRVAGTTPGNVQVTVSGAGYTAQASLYQYGNFNPDNPVYNLYAMGTGTFTATNFAPGVDVPHVVIVSGTNPNDVGNFTVTITGPDTVNIEADTDAALVVRRSPEVASILTGQNTTLSVWASGRQPHSFQWYYGPKPGNAFPPNPALAIPGATSFTYTTPALTQSTSYWCLVTGNATTPASARSSEGHVYVSSGITRFAGTITAQHDIWDRVTVLGAPSGRTPRYEVQRFHIFADGNYTVTLNTTNFNGTMNWYSQKFFPATPAVNFYDGTISSNGPGTLTWTSYITAGDYDLVVSTVFNDEIGSYGGTVTGPNVPALIPPPNEINILNPPVDTAVKTNNAARLIVGLEGAIPRSVQWYQGFSGDKSQPVVGGNNNILPLGPFPTVRTNLYWFYASNSFNAVTSGTVRLYVVDKDASFTGKLREGNRYWRAPNGLGGLQPNTTWYKTFAFDANSLGNYKISLKTTNFNGTIDLYSIKPIILNPNVNHYASATDGTNGLTELKFGIASPSTLFCVISSRGNSLTGDYSGTITGPNPVVMHYAPAFVQEPKPAYQYYWHNIASQPISFVPDDPAISINWVRSTYSYGLDKIVSDLLDTNSAYTTSTFPSFNLEPTQPIDPPFAPGLYKSVRARIENAYGYEDSLPAVVQAMWPSMQGQPTNQTSQYGIDVPMAATVAGAPMNIKWFLSDSSTTNLVRTHTIQSFNATTMADLGQSSFTFTPPGVGTYKMWIVATNYNGSITSAFWNITITPHPVTVTLVNNVFPYTGFPAPIQQTFSAIQYNPPQNLAVSYTVDGVPNAPAPTTGGSHNVTITVTDPNHSGSFSGQVTINKAPLDVYADGAILLAGAAPLPGSLGIHYSGFLANDNAGGIDSPPTAGVSNGVWNAYGQYPITVSGGGDNNYTFNYHTGTLTVADYPVRPFWQNSFTNTPTNVTLIGSAVVTNNALYLTRALPSQVGALVIPATGRVMRRLHVSFDLQIGGGTGADGFSFNCANDATNFTGSVENGLGTGLSICVDTYNNGGQTVPNLALKKGGSTLVQLYLPQLRDNQPHRIGLDLNSSIYNLWVDNAIVAHGVMPGFPPSVDWTYTFAARTGAVFDNHIIDNILIGDRSSKLVMLNGSSDIDMSLATGFGPVASQVNVSNIYPGRVYASITNEVVTFHVGTNVSGSFLVQYQINGVGFLNTTVVRGDLFLRAPYHDEFGSIAVPITYPQGAALYIYRATSAAGPWELFDVNPVLYNSSFYGGEPNGSGQYFWRAMAAPD